MRILIHSNAPWLPTGYGIQTRLLMAQLREAGHEVAVSAFAGHAGADIRWNGHTILPSGQMGFGVDVLIPHIERWRPDVTLTLMDTRMLHPLADELHNHRIAMWLPIDCTPMSRPELAILRPSLALPIAMSRFGVKQLAAEGITAHYAPHAVDTTDYAPLDRAAYREEIGLDDKFVVGLVAANRDVTRKAFAEQFRAFARLHSRHDDTVLLVHSTPRNVGGLDLPQLASDMGILDVILFTDQYHQDSGLMDDAMMCRWYNACDVLTMCSYAEGFGVPLVEAQACGTPVITTAASAMTELAGVGWTVPGDEFWNITHRAWWTRPRVPDITKALLAAYNSSIPDSIARRQRAREWALQYDVSTVFTQYWKPILEELSS